MSQTLGKRHRQRDIFFCCDAPVMRVVNLANLHSLGAGRLGINAVTEQKASGSKSRLSSFRLKRCGRSRDSQVAPQECEWGCCTLVQPISAPSMGLAALTADCHPLLVFPFFISPSLPMAPGIRIPNSKPSKIGGVTDFLIKANWVMKVAGICSHSMNGKIKALSKDGRHGVCEGSRF